MLVLTRKKNEGIIIGDDIKITVVDIRGDKIRIGIEAPRDVSVHRKEVYDHINFPNYLESGNYEKAYETLKNGTYSPSSEELSKLEKGLESLGKLTEDVENKLNKFRK